ncbi:HNH endonuclease signature motif containing protein [Raineyella fluvialis]|uniref:DUF222 domain-containing protein n=1 Tax=Raineyella fluvialis TaxID=2662261 RepID=A0A5Q2FC81_9ACTN|nr:HNH endonuclease signature motif containing protein [Raineyella fluvialis]QGF22683.1 DUF222 domain-containing protein [Raineyella fluvialis]
MKRSGSIGPIGSIRPDPSGVADSTPSMLARAVGEVATFLERGTVCLTDRQLLAASTALQGLLSRVTAAELVVVQELETRGTTLALLGVSTPAWLRSANRRTARQAHQTVRTAAELAAHPAVAQALGAGEASPEQARGILAGLAVLPPDLDPVTASTIDQDVVEHAARFDPDQLRQLANHAVEVHAPEVAEEWLRKLLEQQEAEARKKRKLDWSRDGQGATFFRAKLPTVEGDEFIALIEAYVSKAYRSQEIEALDPAYTAPTASQLRADALMSLVDQCAAEAAAPVQGGDRPRITVVIDEARLRSRMGTAELLDSGETVSAGALRRLACDADILPAVLGGSSQLLDVGRTMRLVSGDLRQAVHLRDRGCAFPACDRQARFCEVHHIVPWACGGVSALPNLVLLCRHHHAMVEPDPRSVPGARWEVRMAADGIPEFLPPQARGFARTPQRNARYELRDPGPP